MIYVTGDTHGDIKRFYNLKTPDGNELCQQDKLIICGDFGFVFYPESYKSHQKDINNLNYLQTLPYEILFVSGNHENFDLLRKFPDEQRYGGTVRKIRNNVFLLKRGEIYTIEEKTFFAMGGAYSRDKYMRIKGESWWEDELPCREEYKNASDNLKKFNHRIDYIITHTAPQSAILLMREHIDYHDAELTGFLDWIYHNVEFSHWYFGHWHRDKKISSKVNACYTDILEVK